MKKKLFLLLLFLLSCEPGGESTIEEGYSPGAVNPGISPSLINITPPSNSNYLSGNILNFDLLFSQNVFVTTGAGTPRLPVEIGGNTRYAIYQSGSGSATLRFSYSLTASDFDMNGIILKGPLELNGGSLKNSNGNDAALTYSDLSLPGVNVIFSGLEFWLDPSDSTTVFQDSACTTQAISGTPVGCIRDKTSHSHNATETLVQRPSYQSAGIQGHPSLLFDGANNILQIANNDHFNDMSGFTIFVIVRPLTLSGPRAIISKRVNTDPVSFNLFYNTNNALYYDISNNTNRRTSSAQHAINNNYLIVMHFDGSLVDTLRTKIFIDGILDTTSLSNFATVLNTTAPIVLGSLNVGYATRYHGYMGEILFFKRALSTEAGGELEKITQYLQDKWDI